MRARPAGAIITLERLFDITHWERCMGRTKANKTGAGKTDADAGTDNIGAAGPGANGIGTLNERPLHAALKDWYARPGDRVEVPVDGYFVDIVRGGLLIEIQTRSVSKIRRKLASLVERHPIRLVCPVAQEKFIVRLSADGLSVLGRRRSPLRGRVEFIFDELVGVAHLLSHPNFSVEVLLVREEELRHPDPSVNWRRRGYAVRERRLIEVVESRLFSAPSDLASLLPSTLPDPFTARMLSDALHLPLRLSQRMVYCLRETNVLTLAGIHGRSRLYARAG